VATLSPLTSPEIRGFKALEEKLGGNFSPMSLGTPGSQSRASSKGGAGSLGEL